MENTFKRPMGKEVNVAGEDYTMESGKVVIASITSCTNTSNPYVMIGAGLVARKAAALGLNRKPWVKTSLAPGSQVVSAYLEAAGLQEDLDKVGFNLVGYGCTTCIGNSGPIQKELSEAIAEGDLVATSVLSGNRNFEGRISPDVRANYLASPPLVVAYALAGTMDINLASDPIAQTADGKDVYLKDIWPTSQEVAELVEQTVTREAFLSKYADVFKGDDKWQSVETTDSQTYDWPPTSTYVQNPPYFQGITMDTRKIENIEGAKVLAVLGDMITTDHISPPDHSKTPPRPEIPGRPAGSRARIQFLRVPPGQPRGDDARYIRQHPHQERDARRCRGRLHQGPGRTADVYLRGGHGISGGWHTSGDLWRRTIRRGLLARLGGQRHSAAGVKAVIAESFERIHRSNLVGMGHSVRVHRRRQSEILWA